MSFLNITGLTALWAKIKAYVSSYAAAKLHSHDVASTTASGFMDKNDKVKLNAVTYVIDVDDDGPYLTKLQ